MVVSSNSARARPTTGAPRIVIEPSDYFLRNFGDMAMLRSAIERLEVVLPGATIEVCTEDPAALLRLSPSVIPIEANGRFQALKVGHSLTAIRKLLPQRFADRVQRRMPRWIVRRLDRFLAERSQFAKHLKQADLLLVGGMGGFTDYFGDFAGGVLRSLDRGLEMGVPVVMVGQGMGPIEKPELRATAGAILPKLDLIALREKRTGPPLLRELGVPASRIQVTGDDAIEFAHRMRVETLGHGIGLNLRRARYSGVGSEVAAIIGQTVEQLAECWAAAVVPVPIQQGHDCDLDSMRQALSNHAAALNEAAAISSLEELVRQVQRCRVVVTGSYHAGVFALSNGIPVVGIAGSTYYIDKFDGLADMFGVGCAVVRVGEVDYAERLRSEVGKLWDAALRIRPELLTSAQRQIHAGHQCYARIAQLVNDRRR